MRSVERLVDTVRTTARSALHRAGFGPTWTWRDGNVTFRPGGFAAAESRPALIARHNYELRYVHRCLEGTEADTSLEIGCGYGRLSTAFADYATESYAVDVNEEAIELARRYYPELTFEVQSATDLPYPDDRFDLVATWTVLQHVPPEKFERAVEEINRVLTDDGTLLVCEATRYPEKAGGHVWDRHVEEYERNFPRFRLTYSSYIDEIDALPDMETPGRVMLFEP